MSKVLKDIKENEFKQESTSDSVKQFITEIFKIVITALIIVIPVRYYVIQPFYVKGESMEHTYKNGDYLIINEIGYRFGEPVRGDVVVLRPPNDPSDFYIKRIIGLPGESIQIKDGFVYILDENNNSTKLSETYLSDDVITSDAVFTKDPVITLGDDEYLVLGDNREHSTDSRIFGPVKRSALVGKTMLRAWPVSRFELIKNPLVYPLANN
jgi:signal peptidase I